MNPPTHPVSSLVKICTLWRTTCCQYTSWYSSAHARYHTTCCRSPSCDWSANWLGGDLGHLAPHDRYLSITIIIMDDHCHSGAGSPPAEYTRNTKYTPNIRTLNEYCIEEGRGRGRVSSQKVTKTTIMALWVVTYILYVKRIQVGETHLLEGWGGPNSDDWTETLGTLYSILPVRNTPYSVAVPLHKPVNPHNGKCKDDITTLLYNFLGLQIYIYCCYKQ